MAKKGPNAHWSQADEDALLDYLWDHRAEAGEGIDGVAEAPGTPVAAAIWASSQSRCRLTSSRWARNWSGEISMDESNRPDEYADRWRPPKQKTARITPDGF